MLARPTKLPFDLTPELPAFDRATRLAKTLVNAVGANIVLIRDGRTWRSRDPHWLLPQRAAGVEHVMRSGELLWLEDLTLDARFELRDFTVDGISARFYAAAPVRLPDGSTPGALSVFALEPRPFDRTLANRLMDLADSVADECTRAEAVERTRRSEQRLQLALELADVFVVDIDYESKTFEVAGAIDDFFEPPITYHTMAEDPLSTVDPRDRDRLLAAWKRYIKNGEPYNPEYRVNRSDGREIWSRTAARVFANETGKITRRISAGQNITNRKRTELALMQAKEEAEAANHAKSTVLANVSHEIRTPLNGVLGMAQAMAMDTLLTGAQRSQMEVIQRSGETLLAILNDILDLSKIEAGKLVLESVDFDIEALALGVQDVFAPTAQAKGCSFLLAVEPAATGVYRGDSTRVRQILYNLVSNALKFTECGEIHVTVSARPNGLEFMVRDSGIGISPEHMTSLFRKFEQGDVSTTRRFGGTGLGLAICHELATLMDGSIRAESSPGEGTTFTVILPLARLGDAANAPRAGQIEPSACPAAPGPPLRVLAAEDNEINQQVLRALLQPLGSYVHIVESGVAAVSAWEADDWDAILMDVHMPQMDGLDATRIIRERERTLGRGRTPIIALTADAMSHQVETYAAAGMDDFVAKPIEATRLFAALEAVLALKPAPADSAVA